MSIYKNKLLKDLSKYYCRLELKDYIIVCTRIKKYNVIDSDDNEYISFYNLITNKCEKIKISEILTHSINNLKIIENIKTEDNFIKKCKLFYKKAKENNITDEVFNKLVMNKIVINNDCQKLICDFNFSVDANILIGENIPDKNMEDVKNSFYGLVDEKINENKNELNQLKKDCETEEDMEDINQIIEMFDDCKEEMCFENAKTLKDIVDEWPPLLLPLPEYLEKFSKIDIPGDKALTELQQFTDLIENIDADTVFEFIKILDDNKETLDTAVYNEYKEVLDTVYHKKFDEKL